MRLRVDRAAGAGGFTVTTTSSVAVASGARSPTAQVRTLPAIEQPGLLETWVTPAGRSSRTTTPVAGAVPWLVTTRV